jgi:precorrin-3B synthase
MQLASAPASIDAVSALRRGACPSLAAPMATGDGLLARFRPAAGELSVSELLAITGAAERFGNGRIEVTSRGNLQLRGIRHETVQPLEDAVLAALEIATGVPVETPPLAGLDPAERTDPRPLAMALREAIASEGLPERVSPKTSVIVDGAGALRLDHLSADLRFVAGETGWSLSFGNEVVAEGLTAAAAMDRALTGLRRMAAAGPMARARDLVDGKRDPRSGLPGRIVGRHQLADGTLALGLAFGFGGIDALALRAFLVEAAELGADRIRPGFAHTVLLIGLDAARAARLAEMAARHGLVSDPADPRLAMAACPGLGRCASSRIDTAGLAMAMAAGANELFDTGLFVHVSGCIKGCAHAAPAPLTFAGLDGGRCRLVVNGRAGDDGIAELDPAQVAPGLAKLARLFRDGRHAQETVSEWLARIERREIAAAFA